jgi:hypothetical protein
MDVTTISGASTSSRGSHHRVVEGSIVAGSDATKPFQTVTPDPLVGDVCC